MKRGLPSSRVSLSSFTGKLRQERLVNMTLRTRSVGKARDDYRSGHRHSLLRCERGEAWPTVQLKDLLPETSGSGADLAKLISGLTLNSIVRCRKLAEFPPHLLVPGFNRGNGCLRPRILSIVRESRRPQGRLEVTWRTKQRAGRIHLAFADRSSWGSSSNAGSNDTNTIMLEQMSAP